MDHRLLMRVLAGLWLVVGVIWIALTLFEPAQSDERWRLGLGVGLFALSLGMLVAAWLDGRDHDGDDESSPESD